jgi:AcrR family transcriptional regulator
VGIRESSFHAHFPSKQAFVDDLMRSTGADAPHELARSLATQALPLEEYVDQILAMIDTVAATLAVYGNRHPRLRRTTPRVLSWSLVAPLAALRASLLAHGASAEHMAEGQAIAHAHVEAWLAAHGVSESSPHVATRAEIEC